MKSLEIIREKNALVIFMVALLVGFVYLMRPFLIPMVLAGIIVILFFPVYNGLKNKLKGRRRISSLMTTLLIFFIFILPSALLVTILIQQVYGFVGTLDLKQTFGKLFSAEYYVLYVEPWIQDAEGLLNTKIDLLGMATDIGKESAKYITTYSPSVLLGTANFIFAFFLMMVGIYFLFLEGPSLFRVFLDVCPLRENHEMRLSRRVRDTINASVYGYLVTGMIQGVIAGGIFAFVGLNAYVVLGTLTFFMSMVPVIGAAGVWIPVCLWFALQGQTWPAIAVFVGGAGIISMIDNFVKPIIIEGRTKIHPLLIFFSLFGGIKFFGPLGILFGPVITALLIATIHIYRDEFA